MSAAKRAGLLRRALLVAVTAALAGVLVDLFSLTGVAVIVAALVAVDTNLGGSLRNAAAQGAGTIIAAPTAAISASLLGAHAGALALASFVVVAIVCAARLPSSVRLATVTVPVVVLVPGGGAWQTAGERLADVSIGIGAALAVSVVAWPVCATARVRKVSSDLLAVQGRRCALLVDVVNGREPLDREALRALAERAGALQDQQENLLTQARYEPGSTHVEEVVVQAERRLGEHVDELEMHAASLVGTTCVTWLGPMADAIAQPALAATQVLVESLRARRVGALPFHRRQIRPGVAKQIPDLREAAADIAEVETAFGYLAALDGYAREQRTIADALPLRGRDGS